MTVPAAEMPPEAVPRARRALRLDLLLVAVTAALLLAVPLYVSMTGQDMMRLPKELLLRAGAILIAAIAAIGLVLRKLSFSRRLPVDGALAIAAVAWCAITTLTSTNRTLSLRALAYVTAAVVVYFAASYAITRMRPILVLGIALVPAIFNAVAAMMQALGGWNPFFVPEELPRRAHTIGFLGNPDYVGAYMVPAILTALAIARAWKGVVRFGALGLVVVFATAAMLSQSITTLIALVAGIVTMAFVGAGMRMRIAGIVVLIAVVAGIWYYPATRARFRETAVAVVELRLDALISGRLGAFVAAAEMAKSRPLVGMGPGCFAYHFMTYRIAAEDKYTFMRTAGKGLNFGEVHNDHLQLLAETGVPGWLIFAGALIALGLRTLTPGQTPTVRFARTLATPLAVSLAVLALAQFPLELASVLLLYIWLAVTVFRWSDDVA
ncbi:MAG TPA: O-antigen ligase family protein [Thermoanaerobaculia bacterium]|nr:O-antigen ligase family protein [Thermoanaerobaculia bacterium]